MSLQRGSRVDRVLVSHPRQDPVGVDAVRGIEGHDVWLSRGNTLQAVHVVRHQWAVCLDRTRGQEEIPRGPCSLRNREEPDIGVEPGLVTRVLERAKNGALSRTRIGQKRQCCVGMCRHDDRSKEVTRSSAVLTSASPGLTMTARTGVEVATAHRSLTTRSTYVRDPPTMVRHVGEPATDNIPWFCKKVNRYRAGYCRAIPGAPTRRMTRSAPQNARRSSSSTRPRTKNSPKRADHRPERGHDERPVEPTNLGEESQESGIGEGTGLGKQPKESLAPAYSNHSPRNGSTCSFRSGVSPLQFGEQSAQQWIRALVVHDEAGSMGIVPASGVTTSCVSAWPPSRPADS